MLPDLSSLSPLVLRLRRWMQRGLALICVVVLGLGMTACTGVNQPPRSVLLKALGLQIELTQSAIATSLDLDAAGAPEVSRVRVESQEAMTLADHRGLHLTGRFDWRLPGDRVRVDSPFELFLERGERGESWRLAQPAGSSDGGSQDWLTFPLPIDAG
ncbi:MAG: hypothetical protein CBD47_00930 [Synechococcus sp. TMED187]|uniref:hypothetical protein n=1 Tax=Synechococcus sp. MIT S9451 TaxID=3082543 RepID=UPI000B7263FB|nr:hypothetical protein [Synechococcus sp. NAT40]OUW49895.1 MAG: hypothetical protein CBD47_00930 [Synechococcus sp. TMED187]RZO13237.1 MAG: hypothetical protein EVB08_06015 [Synechococcus sp. MED-G135]